MWRWGEGIDSEYVKIPGLEEKNAEVFFLITINSSLSSLIKTLLLSPLAMYHNHH